MVLMNGERVNAPSSVLIEHHMLRQPTDLPEPLIPYLKKLKTAKVSETLDESSSQQTNTNLPQAETRAAVQPSKSRRLREESFENPEIDPWASPAVHTSHRHAVNNEATPRTANATTAARPIATDHMGASRTTSAYTTRSTEADPTSGNIMGSSSIGNTSSGSPSGGWGSYENPSGGFPNGDNAGAGAAGFGSGGDEPSNPSQRNTRSLGGGRTTNRGVEETVTITILPEKEGIFMFQHRNYEVKSARRASTVVRRYSDFVWLLDCLHKRYPFRQLPLLPPKRVAGMFEVPFIITDTDSSILVNGRHLSSDVTFIEKRRRGLVRFTNALVRHPVLSQEQLVVMFLTVPTVSLLVA